MLLRVPHSLPPTTELRFELFLPGLARPLRGEGEVVRLTLQGREPFPGIAVEFRDFAASDKEILATRLRPDRT
jgi:hypothetical protein